MMYRERWEAEIAEMRRVLTGLSMKEECKWGKPTYTVDGKNIVIMQGFKEYFGLGFFQGALLTDPKKLLVQLGQVQAGRVAGRVHPNLSNVRRGWFPAPPLNLKSRRARARSNFALK